jgi:hypothetical protein
MKRWVVLGALIAAGLVFFMMRQLGSTSSVATAAKPAAEYAKAVLPPPPVFPDPAAVREEEPEPEPPKPGEPVKKLDPKSTEFFQRFDEMIAPHLTREAAACYNGGKQRDQKIKFGFTAKIRDGRVTIREVKVLTDTLDDKALANCMLEKVSNYAKWQDDAFPDWEQEDEVLIRIRALKKYKQEEDREYFPPTKM